MDIRRHRWNYSVGLTLIELVVVLGVLAVIASITIPRLNSQKASVESVSFETLSLFQLAQQRSRTSFSTVSVSMNRTIAQVTSFNVVAYANNDGGANNILSSYVPNDSVLVSINRVLDAILFSPNQDVQGKFGSTFIPFTEPLIIRFTAAEQHSNKITIFPKTRRVKLN